MKIDLAVWSTEAQAAISHGVDVIGNLIFTYPEIIAFEAGCAALALALWLLMRHQKNKPAKGELDEMKRRTELEATYADKVHDFMLDMLVKGEITRKEYKRDCRRFGVAFRLLDLLRPVRSKIGIKHKILRNVAANHATLPFIQAEKIPGPKPGKMPVLPSKPKARKVWVAVGKRRIAA